MNDMQSPEMKRIHPDGIIAMVENATTANPHVQFFWAMHGLRRDKNNLLHAGSTVVSLN